MMSKPKIVYMGTPGFAVPALEMLAQRDEIELALVVTQPDRPAGRGKVLTPSPVKGAAIEHELSVYQPESLKTAEARRPIAEMEPDLIVVAAYGIILGKSMLEMAPSGCVNLHASLLPKYRGANPIAASIWSGDEETGVTLMRMERGLDTGPMLASITREIEPTHTTESLTLDLAQDAASLLSSNLSGLLDGSLPQMPQPAEATCTRMMTKDDGRIDWTRSASQVDCHVRAMWPWPRAFTALPNGERLQVHTVSVLHAGQTGEPGSVEVADGRAVVACGSGAIVLETIQLPGKRPLSGTDLLNQPFVRDRVRLGDSPFPANPPLVTDC